MNNKEQKEFWLQILADQQTMIQNRIQREIEDIMKLKELSMWIENNIKD